MTDLHLYHTIIRHITHRCICSVFILVTLGISTYSFSQTYRWRSKPQHTWILGLGYHAVDDYSVAFGDIFAGHRTWHILPYPARFSVERNLKYGFGVTGLVHYNQYKSGRYVNEVINNSLIHVVSIDAMLKYRFNMNYKRISWFDPYLGIGLGYTLRFGANNADNVTANIHVGSNFWFTERIGLQIETSAKLGLGASFPGHSSSYLQHSASFLYRIYPNNKQRRDKARYKWTKKKPKGNVNRI